VIHHPLLAVGLLLIASFLGGKAANGLKLPRVSGYLVAGMLMSPSFLNILPSSVTSHDLSSLTEIALGIIAYSIGGSLVYKRLKQLGKSIAWITVAQAMGAFLFTTISLVVLWPLLTDFTISGITDRNITWAVAIVIGAISAATAPGAVLAIISEYRAKGPFTTTLLGVIALDDGLTIILFAIASTIANMLLNPGSVSFLKMAITPFIEIGLSTLIGVIIGFGLKYGVRLARRPSSVLMLVLGAVCVASGTASVIHASPLLTNMIVGFIVANWEPKHHQLFHVLEQIEEPIFGLFFSLAGAHFDITVIKEAGLLGLAILIIRVMGKQAGTWLGANLSKASPIVKKYLGLGLFPQAGVTVGLVLIAEEFLPSGVNDIVVNAVIGSVILNELIAPPLVTFAFRRAGEIK